MKDWKEFDGVDSLNNLTNGFVMQEEFLNFEEVLEESFRAFIPYLKKHAPKMEGAVLLCDPNGVCIHSYPASSPTTIAEEEKRLMFKGVSWKSSEFGRNAIYDCMQSGKYEFVAYNEHTTPVLQSWNSLALPIFSRSGRQVAILGMIVRKDRCPISDQQAEFYLQCISVAFHAILSMNLERKMNQKLTYDQQRAEVEAQKREVLFQVAKKIHSAIDVDSVLKEIIHNLKLIYPAMEIDLYLSQDNNSTSLSVKPLSFDNVKEDLCARAFMEGNMLFEKEPDGKSVIAAPLSGKQGVYGVLRLCYETDSLAEEDTQFISMLADSAGIAFENAKLYEQSNFLISELRLINEITSRLNQSLKLQDIFNFASKELLTIFNADYGCILQLDEEKNVMVVQASNLPSIANEVFSLDYGYSGIVYRTKEPVIISDYLENPKVESKLMQLTGSRSLIASPIIVASKVVGVILVAHRQPDFFSYENYKLLQVLSGHIGLAITNASLHAEVRRMVITDNLTGLSARSYLDEQISIMQKKDLCGSLIMVDIDYFKKVNDTYGHQVGDQILIQVSQIIKSSIRETDIAARWGGEELAIYLPQSTIEHSVRVAERIRTRILQETNPPVTVSCGVSQWNWEDEKISVESLFYRADMALYEAKNAGRNQVRVK